MTDRWIFENSPLGTILVPQDLPPGTFLFYTTAEFDGFLNSGSIAAIQTFIEARYGIRAVLSTCEQVHGLTAFSVEAGERWQEHPQCDALFTSSKSVALGIKVADCLPVTLVDSTHSVIANIHSGWRGTVRGIVPKTIAAMREQTEFSADVAGAWLGPSIRQCCFEVGEEVIAEFSVSHPDSERFVDRTLGPRPHLDLPGCTRALLIVAGFND